MSSDSDTDDDNICPELTKKYSKGLKDVVRQIFVHERSYIWTDEGMAFASAPSLAQRRDHLQFLTDPSRYVFGAATDAALRHRLNILTKEPIFAHHTKTIATDAAAIEKILGNDNFDAAFKKITLRTNFADAICRETLAELTAAYLYHTAITNNRHPKRTIENTVGLLRMPRTELLGFTPSEIHQYHGRSFVSFIHLFQQRPTLLEEYNSGSLPINNTQSQSPPPQMVDTDISRKRGRINYSSPSISPLMQPQHQLQQQQPPSFLPQPPRIGGGGKTPLPKYVVIPAFAHIKCDLCKGQGHLRDICVSGNHPDSNRLCYCCNGIGHFSGVCPSPKQVKPAN